MQMLSLFHVVSGLDHVIFCALKVEPQTPKLELSNVVFGFQDLRGVYLIVMYIPSINRYTCISYIYTYIHSTVTVHIYIYYIHSTYLYIYIYVYE